MIPPETIERVYSAAKIEEIVGDYVSLKRSGANMKGLCPFHSEKTGSFMVSPSKGIFKCFGCGKSGHAIGFVMEIEQCGFADAVRQVAKKYHIEIVEREQTEEEKQKQDDRESMFVVNEFAKNWFEQQLWESQEGQIAGLQYFRERGLTDQTIREYGLGYSPEKGNPLSDALKKQGFVEKYIIADPNAKERWQQTGTGLCGKSEDGRTYDRFRGRVMFPIHTVSGKIVAFAGRIIKKNDKVGKYVNSPDSIIYSKTNELYGLFLAKQWIAREDLCYMVEGQMDVISMHQAGIKNVVCSGGTALTTEQIRLIHRFTSNITVIYDGDAAGIHAALRGIDMFLEEGFNVKVLLLPDGEDPDSYARTHNASDFIEYIQKNQVDFIHYKANLLLKEVTNPQQRGAAIKDICNTIAILPETVKRLEYVKTIASLTKNDETLLFREIERSRRQYIDDRAKKKSGAIQNNTKDPTQENSEGNDTNIAQELMYTADDLAKIRSNNILERNYLELLRIIVRYGEVELFQNVRAGDFIYMQIKDDGPAPNALYKQVMDEYLAHRADAGFVAEHFFKTHPNPEISALAISLIADDYQLSKIYSKQSITENVQREVKQTTDADRLTELVPKLVLEYKLTIVNQRLDEVNKEQKEAGDDMDRQMQLMNMHAQLLTIKNQIASMLGRR